MYGPRKWPGRWVSPSLRYKLVREMNEELKQKGFLTIPGRVSRRYFEESSMDCGKISKEGRKCQRTKTRPRTWYASFYFENWTGKKEKKMKRGFKTKREALEWERTFLQQQTATWI